MNISSGDIWRHICLFLPWKEINRLRVLSKTHNKIANEFMKDRVLVLSEDNLNDIVAGIYNSAMIKKFLMDDGEIVSGYSRRKIRGVDGQKIERYYFVYNASVDSRDKMKPEIIEQILDFLYGEKVLYLPYKLHIDNKMGINLDERGLINKELEFMNFRKWYEWEQGYYTAQIFTQGLFYLKSHKFENWYEFITGVYPPTFYPGDGDGEGELIAQLVVDHGS